MRRLACSALFMILVAGCGPGLAQQDPHDVAQAAVVHATGDAAAIRKLLRGSVVNGGLWFADPACTKQFPAAGEIHPDRFAAFARCLAELHLQPGQRRGELPDMAVLTYAPGIEIEARVLDEQAGPHLVWIGYESRLDVADGLPTISRDALEALRTAGDRDGALTPDAILQLHRDGNPRDQTELAWLKVCLDATGKVTSLRPREATSLEAARVFAAAAGSWRFRPFAIGGHALPVCSMVRLAYPPDKAHRPADLPLPAPFGNDQPVLLAIHTMRTRRISGNTAIGPEMGDKRLIAGAGLHVIGGAFRLCLDETGHVSSVRTVRSTGLPRYDARLIDNIRSWVYAPYVDEGHAVPICSNVVFVYRQY